MTIRLRKEVSTVQTPSNEVSVEQVLNLIKNSLSDIYNKIYKYVHISKEFTYDGMTIYQRGGLYVLKGFFSMNATRIINLPPELTSNGLEVLKISLLFSDSTAKDITINAVVSHPNTGKYIETYTSLIAITNISLVQALGREYQFSNLQQIQIVSANGTDGNNINFAVTLKTIIPTDTY